MQTVYSLLPIEVPQNPDSEKILKSGFLLGRFSHSLSLLLKLEGYVNLRVETDEEGGDRILVTL